jgi:hypothetical protein
MEASEEDKLPDSEIVAQISYGSRLTYPTLYRKLIHLHVGRLHLQRWILRPMLCPVFFIFLAFIQRFKTGSVRKYAKLTARQMATWTTRLCLRCRTWTLSAERLSGCK